MRYAPNPCVNWVAESNVPYPPIHSVSKSLKMSHLAKKVPFCNIDSMDKDNDG